VEAISILFPLSMLIDASVTLSQVLWKVFRYKTVGSSHHATSEQSEHNRNSTPNKPRASWFSKISLPMPSLSPGSPMEIEKKNTGDNFRTFSRSKFLYLGQFYRSLFQIFLFLFFVMNSVFNLDPAWPIFLIYINSDFFRVENRTNSLRRP
jgi:hypothetical protein